MVAPDVCLTCGDVAVEAVVVETIDEIATVEAGGRREQVGIELVTPVAPGDVLLCHAGVALQRLAAPQRPHPGWGDPRTPLPERP